MKHVSAIYEHSYCCSNYKWPWRMLCIAQIRNQAVFRSHSLKLSKPASAWLRGTVLNVLSKRHSHNAQPYFLDSDAWLQLLGRLVLTAQPLRAY